MNLQLVQFICNQSASTSGGPSVYHIQNACFVYSRDVEECQKTGHVTLAMPILGVNFSQQWPGLLELFFSAPATVICDSVTLNAFFHSFILLVELAVFFPNVGGHNHRKYSLRLHT